MAFAVLTHRWPFVGRHAELDDLVATVDGTELDGVVLTGDAGAGKTRLAEECRRVYERQGRRVAHAVGTAAAASVPLGALAHLLPADFELRGSDPVKLFHAARIHLGGSEGGPRALLVVDDVNLLDATSLRLVGQLLTAGLVFLLATLRGTEAFPDEVRAWFGSGRVVALELAPLSRRSCASLLHLALGGTMDGATVATLTDASAGNLLFLRELVFGAQESGALVEVDGVWRLDGPLVNTRQLRELVEARLGDVPPDGREVLERLALCQPLLLDGLEQRVGPELVDRLERSGLVQIEGEPWAREVTLAHPLHGEVLRAGLTTMTTKRLLLEEADRLEARAPGRPGDVLRITSWRLQAGARVASAQLVRAAHLARSAHEFPEVLRLARVAWEQDGDPRAGLLLGEALYETGAFEEAERVYEAASTRADAADPTAGLLATARATNLFWGLNRPTEALAVRRKARDEAPPGAVRDALGLGEADLAVFDGRPAEARALLAAIPPDDDLRTRVARAVAEAPALAISGATDAAVASARRGAKDHGELAELGEQLALAHPGVHVVSEVFALIEAGRLADAVVLAELGHEVVVAETAKIGQVWFALNRGRAAILEGLPVTARRWLAEAAAVAGAVGFVGPRRMALTGLAIAAAYLDDPDEAGARAAEAAATAPNFRFLAPELELGAAWALVAAGEPAAARARLEAGAELAAATGHVTSEAWLWHDLARLGSATAAAPRLRELAAVSDSALVAARAAHATALAARDAAGLEAATDRFEAVGARLLAAEAATQASDAWRRAKEKRRSAACSARAATLLATCEGASTPATLATDTVVPLSAREREIAQLAGGGVTSREIAARLFLSVRTVDNHLQRIYQKLGIRGRAELAGALVDREDAAGCREEGAP